MSCIDNTHVVIRGAGDLATGVAWRLHRCGFTVCMTEIAQPTAIRREVAFSEAVYEGVKEVEGVKAVLAEKSQDITSIWEQGNIAVMVDPQGKIIQSMRPKIVVDAIMAKRNTGTSIEDAPIVIALGPGFTAGIDAHAVIETNRGHNLGRVILEGQAEKNTGIPGNISGYTVERVMRAPCEGLFTTKRNIGDVVKKGDVVGYVEFQPVFTAISGVIRGLIRDGIAVKKGMKIGDVDPRGKVENCYTISDKARAIAGGVLEAIFYLGRQRGMF